MFCYIVSLNIVALNGLRTMCSEPSKIKICMTFWACCDGVLVSHLNVKWNALWQQIWLGNMYTWCVRTSTYCIYALLFSIIDLGAVVQFYSVSVICKRKNLFQEFCRCYFSSVLLRIVSHIFLEKRHIKTQPFVKCFYKRFVYFSIIHCSIFFVSLN